MPLSIVTTALLLPAMHSSLEELLESEEDEDESLDSID